MKGYFFTFFLTGLLFFHSIYQSNGQGTDSLPTVENSKKLSFAIYPAVGYSPETSVQLGGVGFIVIKDIEKANAAYYRPTSISPYFLYTFKNQILTAFDIDYYFTNGTNLNTNIRYYNYPDFFYGLGNENDPDVYEQYTNEYFRLEGRLLKPLDPVWFAGIRYNFQYNNIYKLTSGERLDTLYYLGEDGGWSNGLGGAILRDSRNSTLYPTGGSMGRLEIIAYTRIFGSEYSYVSYLLDLRKYWKIKTEKNVFAWQGFLNLTSGKDIPFYNLPRIAGDNRLRGLTNANLYTDRQSWYTQVEYRRDLFWRLGAVVFAGVGDVAYNLDDFAFDETKYVVGVGGRFQALKDEKFNIRLDVGLGRYGQSAFYLSIREAF